MSVDKQAMLDAVNDLIFDPNPQFKLGALEAAAALARRYPVQLTTELAVLNPLLQVMVTDQDGFRNMQRLIDSKRKLLGSHPCWPEPEPERFDKGEYQRNLMQRRRERAGRASRIENMQRPTKDALRGSNRLDFEELQLATWGHALDNHIQAARQAAGGKLSKPETDAIRTRYWAATDAQLSEKEELVRMEMLKPAKDRRKL
jgi:hypothetical protein